MRTTVQMSDATFRAMKAIVDERTRQVLEEGWTDEHDDQHSDRSIAAAAACYAEFASLPDNLRRVFGADNPSPAVQVMWPKSWHSKWWKPKSRKQDLVRAGALIIAELERMERAGEE